MASSPDFVEPLKGGVYQSLAMSIEAFFVFAVDAAWACMKEAQ
jgi:hypothetical protein